MKNKLTAAVLAASLLAFAGTTAAAADFNDAFKAQMSSDGTASAACDEFPAGWCYSHKSYTNKWQKKTTKTVMLQTKRTAKGKNALDSLSILAGEAGCKFEVGEQEGPLWGIDCPEPNKDGTGTRRFWVYAGEPDSKPTSIVVWDFICRDKQNETCAEDWNEIWDISSNEVPKK